MYTLCMELVCTVYVNMFDQPQRFELYNIFVMIAICSTIEFSAKHKNKMCPNKIGKP